MVLLFNIFYLLRSILEESWITLKTDGIITDFFTRLLFLWHWIWWLHVTGICLFKCHIWSVMKFPFPSLAFLPISLYLSISSSPLLNYLSGAGCHCRWKRLHSRVPPVHLQQGWPTRDCDNSDLPAARWAICPFHSPTSWLKY